MVDGEQAHRTTALIGVAGIDHYEVVSGVGLTLAREILTLHGFDFALESSPGGPTSFVIRMT